MSSLLAFQTNNIPTTYDPLALETDFSNLGPDFLDFSESDSSDDDDHSIESNDSDDTLVSVQVTIVSPDMSISSHDCIKSNKFPSTFEEPPKRPYKSHLRQPSFGNLDLAAHSPFGKRLPSTIQVPLRQRDAFSQRRHISNPCISPMTSTPASKDSLERLRSSSLEMRHGAALCSSDSAKLIEENMDVLEPTSYSRRKRASALNSDILKRFMKHITFSSETDSEESSGDESVESVVETSDERKRASIGLFRALGSAQNRNGNGSTRGGASSPRQARSKAPAIGKGSPVAQGNNSNNSRSISCPSPSIPASSQFGCVEVIVTPPTPRLADHGDFVKGVTLRPHGDFSTQVHSEIEGRLAAPFFDVAPGKQRIIQERQQALRTQWLASHQQLMIAINLGSSSSVPPNPNQRFSAPQFSSYTAQALQRRQQQSPKLGSSYSVRSKLSYDKSSECQNRNYDPSVPKYVAPGRRGYGHARRHSVATNNIQTPPVPQAQPFSARPSRSCHTHTLSMDSGLVSREAVGRSMLAKLERRRNSVDNVV